MKLNREGINGVFLYGKKLGTDVYANLAPDSKLTIATVNKNIFYEAEY